MAKVVGRMNSALQLGRFHSVSGISSYLNQTCRVEFIRPAVFHPHSIRSVGSNSFDQRYFIVYSNPGPLATGWQRSTAQSGEHPHPCWQHGRKRMTTAGNRGNAIDLMVQGMTPPAQCVIGHGDLLVSNGNNGCWPNEFGPTTVIFQPVLAKSREIKGRQGTINSIHVTNNY